MLFIYCKSQPKSLYLMVFRHFEMFTTTTTDNNSSFDLEKKPLTSASSISSDQNKIDLLSDFFDVDYLSHRFEERDLQPLWRFAFSDQYNVSFLGKKVRKTLITENWPVPVSSSTKKALLIDELQQEEQAENLMKQICTTQECITNLKEQFKTEEKAGIKCASQLRKKEKVGNWDGN